MIKFTSDDLPEKLLLLAAERASHVLPHLELIDCQMNLAACHCNGCPLDFDKLIRFPRFDFIHDVVGIDRHICRETGVLQNHFLPRCSK